MKTVFDRGYWTRRNSAREKIKNETRTEHKHESGGPLVIGKPDDAWVGRLRLRLVL